MKEKILKKFYFILAFFTRKYLKKSNPLIIGITGSVGKTSARMIITQVLRIIEKEKYIIKTNSFNYQDRLNEASQNIENSIYTSPKNFNSEIGLILSIFQIENYSPSFLGLLMAIFYIIKESIFSKPWYKVIILEYGIDHPGDMDFLLRVAVPDISVFTKLDKVHSAYFETANKIGDEKFKLMLATKNKVFLNFLDDYCINNAIKVKVSTEFYSGKDVTIENICLKEIDGKIVSLFDYKGKKISTNLFGEENLNYIALALEISNLIVLEGNKLKNIEEEQNNGLIKPQKVSNEEISKINFKGKKTENSKHFQLTLQPGRFNIFSGINNSILIDSTYNAAPESMKLMINNTFSLRDNFYKDFKIGFVIGDMRELGENSEEEHTNLASFLLSADFVVTVGKETKKYLLPNLEGKISDLSSFISSKDAGVFVKKLLLGYNNEKYLILFKGSQNTIFVEEALKEVLLHNDDKRNLVRQSIDWIKKKK